MPSFLINNLGESLRVNLVQHRFEEAAAAVGVRAARNR